MKTNSKELKLVPASKLSQIQGGCLIYVGSAEKDKKGRIICPACGSHLAYAEIIGDEHGHKYYLCGVCGSRTEVSVNK